MALIPDKKNGSDALITLWNEGVAFLVVGILSFIYHKKVEKKKLPLNEKKGKIKFVLLGTLAGAVIPVIFTALMYITKHFEFGGFNKVPKLWMWIIAIFLNALWNELLLRGYLFRLYKKFYGFVFATVVTTLLFISMNHEIFGIGKKFAAIIILFNILMCFVLEYWGSVVFTVFARFSYSFIGAFLLGSATFGEKYPLLANITFSGKKGLAGGKYIVEGSTLTLIFLIIGVAALFTLKYKLWQYFTKEKLLYYKEFIKYHVSVIFNRIRWFFKKIKLRLQHR